MASAYTTNKTLTVGSRAEESVGRASWHDNKNTVTQTKMTHMTILKKFPYCQWRTIFAGCIFIWL
jgi:hypothetical protein